MRLKEDATSWRVNALLKRDFKHDHSEAASKYRSHKDTNKWCRGKVGTPHSMTWHKKSSLFGKTVYIGRCDVCGKRKYSDRLPTLSVQENPTDFEV